MKSYLEFSIREIIQFLKQRSANFTCASNLTSRNCPDKSHGLPRPSFYCTTESRLQCPQAMFGYIGCTAFSMIIYHDRE